MAVNADKPGLWKADILQSVDFYNNWFLQFAPKAYRDSRAETTGQVKATFDWTANLTNVAPAVLRQHPSMLPILRMVTAPPLARDRLIGLASVSPSLVRSMEVEHRMPVRIDSAIVDANLEKISHLIMRLADPDIFLWLEDGRKPTEMEVYRAATIVADRLCGAMADPIIRNSQEQRQLTTIKDWLERRGYSCVKAGDGAKFLELKSGTFVVRLNIPVKLAGGGRQINIPVDTAIMPLQARPGDLPILIEAKSAGDYTNTNKRRKEEATKIAQLLSNYGERVRFVLFLCGYFDSGYLGYEAAEGIDWVWEHRIDDLAKFGV